MEPEIVGALVVAGGSAVFASLGYYINLVSRFNHVSAEVETKSKELDRVSATVTENHHRVIVMETVLIELKELIHSLHDLPVILAKMESLMDLNRDRILRLEQALSTRHGE